MYPRIDKSGAIQISPNGYVSRSTVESDSEAILEVRKEKQTPNGIELGEFLNSKDQYFRTDHRASVGPNLRAAGRDVATLFTGKVRHGEESYDASRLQAFGGALINSIDAVTHAVLWGLRK